MTEDDKNLEPENKNAPEEESTSKEIVPTGSSTEEGSFMGDVDEIRKELSNLPVWVWWGLLVFVLLALILALRATPAPEPVISEADQAATEQFAAAEATNEAEVVNAQATADAAGELGDEVAAMEEVIATNEAQIAAFEEEMTAMEDSLAAATATLGANEALLFAQERTIADLQADAEESANALATAQAESAAAGEAGDSDALATAQAELDAANEALAAAQEDLAAAEEEMAAMATESAELAAAAEESGDTEVMESQIQSLEEDIIAFQADATTRALQIESVYATATAEADVDMIATVEGLEATATAQAEIIATQEAQLDSVRDMLGGED